MVNIKKKSLRVSLARNKSLFKYSFFNSVYARNLTSRILKACKGKALDCNPKGYHACASFKIKEFNKDYHLLSDHACAKHMIVPRRGAMVTLRVTIKGFALAW